MGQPNFLRTILRVLLFTILGVLLVAAGLSARSLYAMRLPDTSLTAEQKLLPYAKYFDRAIATPDPALLAAVEQPMDCKDALPINDINKLLDPGYQAVETGYCIFPDGGGYSSANIQMPGVTLDMINWWFIWHPQEPLRYKIWDKDDHFDAQVSDADRQRFNDTSLPLANRLWGSVHHIRENIGIPPLFRFMVGLSGKDPYEINIQFLAPEECGFDMTRFDFSKETAICAGSGMRHYFRKTADGIELRSRFYGGYVRKDGTFVRDGSDTPISIQSGLNRHMIKEFTNLAAILPELYAEEGP